MKHRNPRAVTFILFSVLITIAAIVFNGSRQRAQSRQADSSSTVNRCVPGRVLVKFQDNILPAHARNIIAALGARDAGEIDHIGVHVLDLPEQADERATAERFESQPEVEFAELDRIIDPADTAPNDPWYVNNEWHLRRISAPLAWDSTTGSSSVTIAILDTGVNGSHEDLNSKMVSGWNVYDNNSNTADVNGHGTLVAGTAAASSNNGIGVASVSWGSRIMPVRISAADGTASYTTAANGLTWAADHGARVANISYRMSTSSTVSSAASYFQNKGGVVTMAAGNESTFDSSSDNPYVLTVSATDYYDALYSWSNTGNNIDVAAPGYVYTTTSAGGYSNAAGTSVAAPIVAGVAALVLAVNPTMGGQQVRDLVEKSADDLGSAGWDSGYGWGRVNAARAVAMAGGSPLPSPSPSPSPTPSPTPLPSPTPAPTPEPDVTSPVVAITSPVDGAKVSVNTSVYVNSSDNVGVTKVDLYVDGLLISTSTAAPFTNKWNTKKATAGSHVLQCRAYDAAGNAGASNSVTVYK